MKREEPQAQRAGCLVDQIPDTHDLLELEHIADRRHLGQLVHGGLGLEAGAVVVLVPRDDARGDVLW